jgi:hypothetical protein
LDAARLPDQYIARLGGSGTNTFLDNPTLRTAADAAVVIQNAAGFEVFSVHDNGEATGNGAGLVGLNASALASGTVPVERLPGQFLWGTNAANGTVTNVAPVSLSGPVSFLTTNSGVAGLTNSGSATAKYVQFKTTSAGDGWIDISGVGPWIRFNDTSSGGDDFDFLVDNDVVRLFNRSSSPQTNVWTVSAAGVMYSLSSYTTPGSITATNGYILPQLTAMPPVPSSSAGISNFVLVNLTNTIAGGGLKFVMTNTAAAGSYIIRSISYTETTYP